MLTSSAVYKDAALSGAQWLFFLLMHISLNLVEAGAVSAYVRATHTVAVLTPLPLPLRHRVYSHFTSPFGARIIFLILAHSVYKM